MGGLSDQPDSVSLAELQLATRNHGMPLEALQWPITPAGLHYLLIHYDIPLVKPDEWALVVGGALRKPAALSLDDLRALPSRTFAAAFECGGNGRALLSPRPESQPWLVEAVGNAEWTGAPLAPVLEEAGLDPAAVEVLFTGLDHGVEGGEPQQYQRSLSVEDALGSDALLAYEMNGRPLPPQHGFPLRLVVPGWYGMTNVKWLARIDAVTEPFTGYQQSVAYHLRQEEDEPGEPVTLMVPRSLMVPPGVPDFFSRRRFVDRSAVEVQGRAWSGFGPIEAVEMSTDAGATWHQATLGEAPESPYAWRAWSWTWDRPAAGDYELCCRATDATGRQQPTEPPWNRGGYANNAVHRVPVTVNG